MTLRSYLELLRFEDVLRSQRFYFVTARAAIEVRTVPKRNALMSITLLVTSLRSQHVVVKSVEILKVVWSSNDALLLLLTDLSAIV